MWALIGSKPNIYQDRIGEPFEEHRTEETMALFTTKDKAEAYIKKNTLKNPKVESFSGWRRFRRNSLLVNCDQAWVEVYEEPDFPIDPE
jgi:hypothetical protein